MVLTWNSGVRIDEVEGKGRCVVATEFLEKGTVIENAECLIVAKDEYEKFGKFTVLEHYLFRRKNGDYLLALGIGSLFNHSETPNVDYRIDGDKVTFTLSKNIQPGEELFIYYGSDLWFAMHGEEKTAEYAESDTEIANILPFQDLEE